MNRAPISRFGARSAGGSTILGKGEVALILDVPGLMRQVVTGDEPAGNRRRRPALSR
jgi:chemotaxis protein histidine kinase CheA